MGIPDLFPTKARFPVKSVRPEAVPERAEKIKNKKQPNKTPRPPPELPSADLLQVGVAPPVHVWSCEEQQG